MKLQFLILLTLAVIYAAAEESSTTETPEQTQCCYPRPPPRKDRGFKKHASRCCEFPVADLYEKFQNDLEACKEEKRKEHEENQGSSTTTTSTTVSPSDLDVPEKDNEFNADLPESMEDNETEPEASTESIPTSSSTVHPTGRHHGPHKGRGKGHKRGGCGKCMKAAFEKQGWSENGTINWDAIAEATAQAMGETVKAWAPIVKEAITNCSQAAPIIAPEQKQNKKRGHGPPPPEKQAWRCIVNNSIMKCPNFPEDNEYCVKLRAAHEKCTTLSSELGPQQFRWCEKPNGRNKGHHHHH